MTSPARAYNDHQGLRRYNIDGLDPHPISVTTLLKTIAPALPLVKWMDKKLIEAALNAYVKTDDSELALEVGKNARWSGNEDADFGTSVHALTERADLVSIGKTVETTPIADQKRAAGFVAQWEKTRDAFDMEILAVEVTFVNRELGYAGTADRVVVIPALSPDPVILDIKTGKNIYNDVALQCAALANCDEILYDDGTLVPVPWEINKRHGVAAHVRARSAKLIPLNLELAWPIFQPLPQLALWRAEAIEVVGSPLTPDEVKQRRADLRLRIKKLPPDLSSMVKSLIAKNPELEGGSTLTWTEEQLVTVEKLFQPFETEARERVEMVLGKWTGGPLELRARILELTDSYTSQVADLTAEQVDVLIAAL